MTAAARRDRDRAGDRPEPADSAPSAEPAHGKVLDLLLNPELELVRGWISDVRVDNLTTMVARAAGAGVAIAPTDNARDAFCELLDVNAGRDGLLPAIVFLDLLAGQVPEEHRPQLQEWLLRGDITAVELDDLKHQVDKIVLDAETAWASHSAHVTPEFLLPRALLRLPIYR